MCYKMIKKYAKILPKYFILFFDKYQELDNKHIDFWLKLRTNNILKYVTFLISIPTFLKYAFIFSPFSTEQIVEISNIPLSVKCYGIHLNK